MMIRTIGIDLGTSNSAAAVMKDGKIRLVPAVEGQNVYGKMFPSIVAFKVDGEILVGKDAKKYSYEHPERTVRWIKRKIGTDYTENIDGQSYSPQEISAMILKKIKKDAENYIGEKIEKAVISAPAYFNNNQRNATKEAGEIAGFEVLRIVSEPTAASLAYGLDKVGKNLKVAVLDLGAGTFDVTILEMNKGLFQVLSTSGDIHLGGKDMDDSILEYLLEEVEEKHGVCLENNSKNLNLLRDAGEIAKIQLSTKHSTSIDTGIKLNHSKKRISISLTRKKLEQLINPQLERLLNPIENSLKDSGLSSQNIDKLILVGGPTRMPIVRKYFGTYFKTKPEVGIDPMGIVATGASVQASVLNGEIKEMLLLDVTPLSLGVETSGGLFTRLIKRNSTIPTEENMTFATQEDYQTSMMIHVLQGEREMAKDNTSVGLFKIDCIPKAPKYEQKVEVTFKIDTNGILIVSAEILETGKIEAIKISETSNLSQDEIIKRIIEATKFNETDEKEKECIEIQNQAAATIQSTKRFIEEAGGKISPEDKKKLETGLHHLQTAMKAHEPPRVKLSTSKLLELKDGLIAKTKKVGQAKVLLSAAEKRLGSKVSEKKKKELKASIRKIEQASQECVTQEFINLREMLVLLEADCGED